MLRKKIFIFIVLVTGLSLSVAFAGTSQSALSVSMQNYAGGFNETCLALQSDDELVLTVTSPYPIRLNLHHHTDTSTIFLLNMLVGNTEANSAKATDDGEYCIELTNVENRPEPYIVDLRYEISSN